VELINRPVFFSGAPSKGIQRELRWADVFRIEKKRRVGIADGGPGCTNVDADVCGPPTYQKLTGN
jgi:hypothetical protein